MTYKRSYKRSMKGSAKKRSRKKRSHKKRSHKKGGYSEKVTKLLYEAKNKASRKAAKMTGTEHLKCPAGKIKRRAYMRKSKSGVTTAVAAKCVKNMGAPGKAKRSILLKEGLLSRYGYNDVKELTKQQREEALEKAVKAYGYVEVIRRLVALSNLTVRTNKELSKKVKNDQEMVSRWYNKAKEAGLKPSPKNA